jgi:hypothetical protein
VSSSLTVVSGYQSASHPGRVLLLQTSFPNASTHIKVVFSTTPYTAYPVLHIRCRGIQPSAQDGEIVMRTSSSGGASFDTGGSDYLFTVGSPLGGVYATTGTASIMRMTVGNLAFGISNAADKGVDVDIYLPLANQATRTPQIIWQGSSFPIPPFRQSFLSSGVEHATPIRTI